MVVAMLSRWLEYYEEWEMHRCCVVGEWAQDGLHESLIQKLSLNLPTVRRWVYGCLGLEGYQSCMPGEEGNLRRIECAEVDRKPSANRFQRVAVRLRRLL